ncbi:Uncharacterised protein family UPF0691 like protein [Aduncisulcus paluster]|uniref:Uncharacterized protein n=1 Tax=Aduncisulcus paluster TaxID=2918883 RepID=A0ABQ5K3Y8_9EUKA|nr:Uncharacterised protein family UPF0691 like protein [Aduncisulcus paluster]
MADTPKEKIIPEEKPSAPSTVKEETTSVRELPARFADASHFKGYASKREHICYRTSSSTYGSIAPAPIDLPNRWHGKRGEFSRAHSGRFYRNKTLNV